MAKAYPRAALALTILVVMTASILIGCGSKSPDNVVATHRSLFDGTLQGIAIKDRPAFSFQGHPEASPGPHDLLPLFERFIHDMDAQKRSAIRTLLST